MSPLFRSAAPKCDDVDVGKKKNQQQQLGRPTREQQRFVFFNENKSA